MRTVVVSTCVTTPQVTTPVPVNTDSSQTGIDTIVQVRYHGYCIGTLPWLLYRYVTVVTVQVRYHSYCGTLLWLLYMYAAMVIVLSIYHLHVYHVLCTRYCPVLCVILTPVFCVLCVDGNECFTQKGGCNHQCINTLGSYECKCNAGYSLEEDGKTCSSEFYNYIVVILIIIILIIYE